MIRSSHAGFHAVRAVRLQPPLRLPNCGRLPRVWALISCASLVLAGCGPTLYAMEIAAAERALEQAKTESARSYAPYELHYAEANLRKAKQEAAEASYEDAIRYADVAERYSHRARIIASRKRAETP
jgi:hypothetical protein